MLLRARILCCTSALAASRQQKYSEVADFPLSCQPWGSPERSHSWAPLQHCSDAFVCGHTCPNEAPRSQCAPSTAACTEQGVRIEGLTDSPQKLCAVGFGPSATDTLLCRFYSLVSQRTGPVTLWTEPWVVIQGEEMHNRLKEC